MLLQYQKQISDEYLFSNNNYGSLKSDILYSDNDILIKKHCEGLRALENGLKRPDSLLLNVLRR